MPRFRIVTIVKGQNIYEVEAPTAAAAEDAIHDYWECTGDPHVKPTGEDFDPEFIHKIEAM